MNNVYFFFFFNLLAISWLISYYEIISSHLGGSFMHFFISSKVRYDATEEDLSKIDVFFSSIFLFVISIYLLLHYDTFNSFFQYNLILNLFGIYFYIGFDGISLLFIFLTAFFIPLCILFNYQTSESWSSEYSYSIICIGFLIISVFSVLDLILFYIFFEAILIPFFYIINIAGSRSRKVHATYLLVFYTMVGSFFMLTSILILYIHCGTSNIQVLWCFNLNSLQQKLLWFCFVVSFLIKVPVFPFHLWLPEAHVESPTEASVILAAVLLKIGVYGFLRIILPLFQEVSVYYSPILIVLNLISLLYTSLSTLKQFDIKRVIAYSSISHMNICMLGVSSFETTAIVGSLILMVGHGFVSGGLFFLIGMLYNRFKTKLILYYSGLVVFMPLWCSFFLVFLLCNMSFPGTSNFIGELLILYSQVEHKIWVSIFFFSISIMICSTYSIWLFNRVSFGTPTVSIAQYTYDLSYSEFCIMVPIFTAVLGIGLFPYMLLDLVYFNIQIHM